MMKMNDDVQVKRKYGSFLLIMVLIGSILWYSGCIQPENLRVTIEGTNKQYTTITDAIINAQDGDIIICKAGRYEEHVRINQSITLLGAGANTTRIIADGTGDVITVVSDNVTIKGFQLEGSGNLTLPDVDAGIDIQADHISISDMIIKDANYAVYLYGQHNISLFDLIIENNTQRGVYMNTGENMQISDCVFGNNSFGLYMNRVTSSLVQSNQFRDHDNAGLYLGADSERNEVDANTFTDNNYGVHIKSSTQNNLTQNLFLSNTRGLYVCCGGRDNLIYTNVFLSNIEHAYGYPVNRFNSTTIGNYWDDYQGIDDNDDGIGDTPYNATTSDVYGVTNIDYRPMMQPS